MRSQTESSSTTRPAVARVIECMLVISGRSATSHAWADESSIESRCGNSDATIPSAKLKCFASGCQNSPRRSPEQRLRSPHLIGPSAWLSAPRPVGPPPRFVGIDDFATKKGQHYGTIVIDLERGCVIDLLPGRDGTALEAWLQANPQVEVVTRDRWAAYAKAIRASAPQTQQVTDRWHLLKNLREAVERVISRHASDVRMIVSEQKTHKPETRGPSADEATEATTPQHDHSLPDPPLLHEEEEPTDSPRQRSRADRFRQVREFARQGISIRGIVRRTGLNRKTVRRYLREDRCPDWRPGRHGPSQLDPFQDFIKSWIAAGGRNARELHRRLLDRGSSASYTAVSRYVRRWLGSTGRPGPRPQSTEANSPPTPSWPPSQSSPPPSARQLSFQVVGHTADSNEETLWNQLRRKVPALDTVGDLAGQFAAMIRRQLDQPLQTWLSNAKQSGVVELERLANSLQEDEAAVSAALSEHWSNGPTEGHVNRLKFVKRAMYGRGKLDLLAARLTGAK